MKLPDEIELPFFAYGIFKRGQLGIHRIKDCIERHECDYTVKGRLLVRDGLPILKTVPDTENSEVSGDLFYFIDGDDAYGRIVQIEPEKQYIWGVSSIKTRDGVVRANVLFGKNPEKGSVSLRESEDSNDWDGSKDPLFKDALDLVEEIIKENPSLNFPSDVKAFFRYQMAYMLLWSSIERYASLRYHLGTDVWQKVKRIADEPEFVESLKEVVTESPSVQRADDPQKKATLSPDNPQKALEYYYQVRSNMVHRGKSAYTDFKLIKSSLSELFKIFIRVKNKAFEFPD